MTSGTKRNDPCPCGSGKKFKNCCLGRKPVDTSITLQFSEPVQVPSYSVDWQGRFAVHADGGANPVGAWIERSYARNKGPKSLFKAPVAQDFPSSLVQTGEPLTSYNNVFTIDTNTGDIDGTKVSVTCIMQGGMTNDENGRLIFGALPIAMLEFHSCPADQEEFAIHLLQSMIVNSIDYSTSNQYAIINDYSLGALEARNKRSVAIHSGVFLASNIDLMYASADSGRDLANKLIQTCDKTAKGWHKALTEAGIGASEALNVTDAPCSRFKVYPLPLEKPLPAGWLKPSLDLPVHKT